MVDNILLEVTPFEYNQLIMALNALKVKRLSVRKTNTKKRELEASNNSPKPDRPPHRRGGYKKPTPSIILEEKIVTDKYQPIPPIAMTNENQDNLE
jgi:hypothetical protein